MTITLNPLGFNPSFNWYLNFYVGMERKLVGRVPHWLSLFAHTELWTDDGETIPRRLKIPFDINLKQVHGADQVVRTQVNVPHRDLNATMAGQLFHCHDIRSPLH